MHFSLYQPTSADDFLMRAKYAAHGCPAHAHTTHAIVSADTAGPTSADRCATYLFGHTRTQTDTFAHTHTYAHTPTIADAVRERVPFIPAAYNIIY